MIFEYCENLVSDFEKAVKKPVVNGSPVFYSGVDLGTSCIVLAVLDENLSPVAGAYKYTDVVRDGMVVDYLGAIGIVKTMKQEIEEKLGTELVYAAAAIPPGTYALDGGAIRHVVQGAGFELTSLLDEPTAANAVLKIKNGAVVDIGGGTTGISIFRDGKVVYTADEPTGGTHFSLVLAGAYKMPFEEAEAYKRDSKNHKEIMPIVRPVVEKVSSILRRHILGRDVRDILLVGGASCLTGIETIIEQQTGILTHKPKNPLFVTPLGIALNCCQEAL